MPSSGSAQPKVAQDNLDRLNSMRVQVGHDTKDAKYYTCEGSNMDFEH